MKYVCFILALVFLFSVPFIPVLAVDDEPAPEPEELPEAAEETLFEAFQATGDPEGEDFSYDLFLELYRIRAGLTMIFWGVIFLCGVILGCFAGVTLIRMWGA